MIRLLILILLLTIQPAYALKDQEFLHRTDPVPIKKVKPQPIVETPLEDYPQFLEFLNDNYDDKYIIVNRASQQLVLIDHMEVILSMRVIVGRRNWTTPLATTSITHIITNPYWTVPVSIAVKETIPKIEKNSVLYQKLGYRVFYKDEVYDAEYVEYFLPEEITIRQLPGKYNALGRVKFKLSNMNAIYMHDTPGRHKFKRKNRKLSHGCIRLEKPLKLLESISYIKYEPSVKEKWHRLKVQVPVYIVNWKK